MKVAISGSYGLIGTAVRNDLTRRGFEVFRLVRRAPLDPTEIAWDPTNPTPIYTLEGFDAVVHLAGENLASGRWTKAYQTRIWQSRVQGTTSLATALSALSRPPSAFLCASAIGFYGRRGADEILTEKSDAGHGFLPELCKAWEAASSPLEQAGIRVVHMRLGVVLSRLGGMLRRVLTPFQLGLGGRLGNGTQVMSWIDLDDVASAMFHLIDTDSLSGPVNLVSPRPVTNRYFANTLGRVLKRPAVLPLPAGLLRLLFGAMADEVLLAGSRVHPEKLLASDFHFRFPELPKALEHALDRPPEMDFTRAMGGGPPA
jgi:uncharacterized protein